MRQPTSTTVLGCLFVALAATGYAASASADAASDCRQEAEQYGFAQEGLDDYISGCLASRGEYIDSDTADVEYIPPVEVEETDDLPDPQTNETEIEQ